MMIVALDPLLSSDIGFSVVAVMLLKVVLAFALLMVSVMLVIWFERKIVADMHNRVGPSLAGPWGILQTLADGIKLFFKEDTLKRVKKLSLSFGKAKLCLNYQDL